jgi:hypothetical protein
VLVSLSVIAYGYLMTPGGLVVATVAAVYIGALAGHEFRWKEVSVLAVVLVVFSWLVFVKGLTLPLPMCPSFVDTARWAEHAMDVIDSLQLGFQVAFTWNNVLYCLIGVLLGTLIGVLPGIGPVPTIAMLLPITFSLDPTRR